MKGVTSRLCGIKEKRESHLRVGSCTDSKRLEKVNRNLKRVVQDLTLRETWIKGLTIKLKLPKLRLPAKSVLPYTLLYKMKFS